MQEMQTLLWTELFRMQIDQVECFPFHLGRNIFPWKEELVFAPAIKVSQETVAAVECVCLPSSSVGKSWRRYEK